MSMNTVRIYASGLIFCSVCAPKEMMRSEVENDVNAHNPTGIDHLWHISSEDFKDGTKNGAVCPDDETKVHYLLNC